MTEMIIRREEDGTISFGNYELEQKTKVSDFENAGDIYKIKTFKEITKLEKNEMFVYESVPGTAVSHMKANVGGMEFQVESSQDVQITVGLEEETVYRIFVDSEDVGTMKTNLSGKLSVNVELEPGKTVSVKIVK